MYTKYEVWQINEIGSMKHGKENRKYERRKQEEWK